MTKSIWSCDFEFNFIGEGNNPSPVCFCATELYTQKTFKIWLDGENNIPAPLDFNDPDMTYIAYFAVAEMSCHLQLGWPIPKNILDLYAEWRVLTNDGMHKGNSLLDACKFFDVVTIESAEKEAMRGRIIKGAPFEDLEKIDILSYCETDVLETLELYKKMLPHIDNIDRALFRGQFMAINAIIEHNGVPMDSNTLELMKEHWDTVKLELIKETDKDFGFFDGITFKTQAFINYLEKHNMQWTFTEKGNLSMDDDTWSDMVLVYPELRPIKDIRALLGKLKKLNITCGNDKRNRGMLSPFSTKTGRNAPKAQCIFTNSAWLRSLIKPEEGQTLAYIDYEQQEFFIAAILSKDQVMQATYSSGDPYLQFAKMAGAIPPDGTKKTHKAVRDTYKQACLAIQYGMRAQSLSIRVNKPLAYANELIKQHQRLFPRYWKWQDIVITQSKLHKEVQTSFGWRMKVLQGTTKEDLTLGNFLMQSTGADILRIACYLLNDAGIKIVAPVHDALMIQVDSKTADPDIKRAESIMHEASRIVLGQPLRTETVRIDYPNRYMDDKGKTTWDRVQRILEGIQNGTITPQIEDMGSKWVKHVERLNKRSHNNLSSWYKDVDADLIDFESLKDSTLSRTENGKNLKGMWREFL
ncbi:MAG: DNA polymerase [Candidatus Methanoperedens sp.]